MEDEDIDNVVIQGEPSPEELQRVIEGIRIAAKEVNCDLCLLRWGHQKSYVEGIDTKDSCS